MHENCPNTEFFLVHIFTVFSPNTGKPDQKKSLVHGRFSCSDTLTKSSGTCTKLFM